MTNMQQIKCTTAEEYTIFLRKFVTLVDQQFSEWEDWAKNKEKLHSLASQMPAIISLVNTIGYLRGQDGVFVDIRPHTDNQKEFYRYEDIFEDRLKKLINVLLDSEEKEFFIHRLENYFVKSRIK